ncbi:MAG: GPR endopeptidase [Clostridia bacterium]
MKSNEINFRTDLADERVDVYKKHHKLSEVNGVLITNKEEKEYKLTCVEVTNEEGEKALNKPIGKYITMQLNDLMYTEEEEKQKIIEVLSGQIKDLIKDLENKPVLIVGLGNKDATPDAIGPGTVEHLDITRHLIKYAKNLVKEDAREISAIAPGVLGTTGIETSEIVHSIVKKIKPGFVIAIDSLASQSIERVAKCIQLSNTGISPGSGVKNKREGLNFEALGIPVIALGLPTVVDMATITSDAISRVYNENNMYKKVAEILDTENYMVTPKEIDIIVQIISEILASSLNVALRLTSRGK